MAKQYHTIAAFFKKVKCVRQSDLAKAAGMSPQQLNHLKKGVRSPTPEHVDKLNAGLDKLAEQIQTNRIKH